MDFSLEQQIKEFKKQRNTAKNATICYAPSISLNFDQSGDITACCFNRSFVLGRYPDNQLMDIWEGEKIKRLREALENDDLSLGCQQCERYIKNMNFEGVLIRHFDDHAPLSPLWKEKEKWWKHTFPSKSKKDFFAYPVMFEFELSNQCNLECIMCGGKWSSAIRKNRENQSAIKSPYDENFVGQIRPFLPHLKRANFLGGEPFLIHVYQDIWQDILDINPSIEVAITSNGTVLNPRARKIVEQLPNCKITLSIDSLQKDTWENIRRNGKFDILKSNLEWLISIGKVKSFSVCPMIQNRYEIPEIIQFCVDHDLDIYFNTVNGPLGGKIEGIHYSLDSNHKEELLPEVALSTLSENELLELEKFYLAHSFKGKYKKALNSLIFQIENWRIKKGVYVG